MEHDVYTLQMSKAAIETQSEIDDATFALYWDRFKDWSNEEFSQSIDKCCRTLNRFPSVAMIYKHKPVDQGTGELKRFKADQEQYIAIGVNRIDTQTDEIIDQMTINEVSLRLKRHMDIGKKSADWLAEFFEKRNRKGTIRSFLSEAIESEMQ